MSAFSVNVKRAMKAAGVTQIELAETLGISQGELSRRINSDDLPTEEFLTELAKALDVKPKSLLEPVISNVLELSEDMYKFNREPSTPSKPRKDYTDRELIVELHRRIDFLEMLIYRILTKLDQPEK